MSTTIRSSRGVLTATRYALRQGLADAVAEVNAANAADPLGTEGLAGVTITAPEAAQVRVGAQGVAEFDSRDLPAIRVTTLPGGDRQRQSATVDLRTVRIGVYVFIRNTDATDELLPEELLTEQLESYFDAVRSCLDRSPSGLDCQRGRGIHGWEEEGSRIAYYATDDGPEPTELMGEFIFTATLTSPGST